MTIMQFHNSPADTCRIHRFLLAFTWCSSLGIGSLFAIITQPITVSLMCIAPMCRVSIFGLVMILLFPLILSAVAVKFSVRWLLYPIAFLDGLSFGYFISGMIFAFGSSGWIIGLLLGFSKQLFTIPKLWFFFRCFADRTDLLPRLGNCVFVALIISIVDYFLISPFLITLVI